MNRLSCFIFVLIVSLACSTVKKGSAGNKVVLVDSIKSADLFRLSPEKQLSIYQNIEHVSLVNFIEAGRKKYPLTTALADFSHFSFSFLDTNRTIEDFIRQTNVVGIIAVKNDRILFERYNKGLNQDSKWVDFSVAKSVTSLLYGAAIQDGFIKSLDDKIVKYLPQLKGSAYDEVSIQNFLQMASGVQWNDDPRTPDSDLMKVAKLSRDSGENAVYRYLSQLKRAAPAGTKFNYNTVETTLAAIILRNAIGKTLSEYLSERIWKPFGMHADANWMRLINSNTENGGCCISATLRDHALLGLLALQNGKTKDGKQILPVDWIKMSTSSSVAFKGYGYYWWLHPNGRYFASGAYGQQVEVDPAQKAVVAVLSYWPIAYSKYHVDYLDAFIEGMMQELKSK